MSQSTRQHIHNRERMGWEAALKSTTGLSPIQSKGSAALSLECCTTVHSLIRTQHHALPRILLYPAELSGSLQGTCVHYNKNCFLFVRQVLQLFDRALAAAHANSQELLTSKLHTVDCVHRACTRASYIQRLSDSSHVATHSDATYPHPHVFQRFDAGPDARRSPLAQISSLCVQESRAERLQTCSRSARFLRHAAQKPDEYASTEHFLFTPLLTRLLVDGHESIANAHTVPGSFAVRKNVNDPQLRHPAVVHKRIIRRHTRHAHQLTPAQA